MQSEEKVGNVIPLYDFVHSCLAHFAGAFYGHHKSCVDHIYRHDRTSEWMDYEYVIEIVILLKVQFSLVDSLFSSAFLSNN